KEQPYCWRFRVDDQELQFSDLISGTHRLNPARSLGDFPVTRKGSPTLTDRSNSSVHCYPPAAYQLAVVIDDMDQGVTDVVRGDDLVISTFRQIQLINVLGGSIPTYAHVPLVCGQDGRRLAKRHGDTRLASYREQGVAPETVVRWAAGVSGWNTANLSKLSLSELHLQLIDTFSWSSLPRDKVDRLL
ncbi:MAG: glutamate--tRNA ligase family protein, partial [Planctomycetota bacterium]